MQPFQKILTFCNIFLHLEAAQTAKTGINLHFLCQSVKKNCALWLQSIYLRRLLYLWLHKQVCKGGKRLARRRKRKSRRRLEGRRILEHIPQFSIESGEDKPVTAARKYIQTEGIVPPAMLLVKRNEHTTDRYFWAEKGLFGAQYVEENHFLFPSLRPKNEEMIVS